MTLNEVMKDTADAIREKTGKSELIAPVDFASEIKGITSGGGGAELDGEYFLAKPNGRYWKFTFSPSPSSPYVDPNSLSAEQLEALSTFYSWFELLGVVYGAAVCNEGVPLDDDLRVDGIAGVGARIGRMLAMLNSTDIGIDEFNRCFFSVWKECSVKTSIVTEYIPLQEYDLVSFVKTMMQMEGQEVTDEMVLMMFESQFMLIPATEEEYKAARREN
jgi:hypothetical protein